MANFAECVKDDINNIKIEYQKTNNDLASVVAMISAITNKMCNKSSNMSNNGANSIVFNNGTFMFSGPNVNVVLTGENSNVSINNTMDNEYIDNMVNDINMIVSGCKNKYCSFSKQLQELRNVIVEYFTKRQNESEECINDMLNEILYSPIPLAVEINTSLDTVNELEKNVIPRFKAILENAKA